MSDKKYKGMNDESWKRMHDSPYDIEVEFVCRKCRKPLLKGELPYVFEWSLWKGELSCYSGMADILEPWETVAQMLFNKYNYLLANSKHECKA